MACPATRQPRAREAEAESHNQEPGRAALLDYWQTLYMAVTTGLYLAVGSVLSESVTTKITTAGNEYRLKLLASNPGNWWTIVSILRRSDLVGAIVKLTASDFKRIHSARYRDVASALFTELARHPYLIVVHEAVVGAGERELPTADEQQDEEDWDGWTWNDHAAREYFGTLDRDVRDHVLKLLTDLGLTFATYKKNAEASVLAAAFVEDTQSNLLFRIYVPSGRLYEAELSKLLSMFHDWLGSVKHLTVRQGGYKTPSGRVIEFYGEPGMTVESVSADLEEFAQFLELLDNPLAAEQMLQGFGLDRAIATELTARYAKEARRVLLDTKHERDRRMLSIQQELESELTDLLDSVSASEIERFVRALVPASPFTASPLTRQLAPRGTTASQITINQQVFQHVEGVVTQSINGTVSLGTPADQLIKLVREAGGDDRIALEADARELADMGAPTPARIGARQRLKEFVARSGQRLETATFQMIWKWLEAQIGGGAG